MNIDEMKILLSYACAFFVGGIVSFLLTYLRQKGKNLATREDIANITDKIEGVKFEHAFLLQRRSRIHDRQVEILSKVYKYLLDAQEYSKLMTKKVIFEGEKPEEYPLLLQSAVTNAYKEFAMGRLLLPSDVAEQIQAFFHKVSEGQVHFAIAKHAMVSEGNVRAKCWEKAGEIAYHEIPALLRIIEKQAHNIIHGKQEA